MNTFLLIVFTVLAMALTFAAMAFVLSQFCGVAQ